MTDVTLPITTPVSVAVAKSNALATMRTPMTIRIKNAIDERMVESLEVRRDVKLENLDGY